MSNYNPEYNHQYYLVHRQKALDYARKYYCIHYQTEATRNHLNELAQWRWENPSRGLWVRNQQKTKINIFTHYSIDGIIQCARCGIRDIDVLCIDHINGDGAEQRREQNIGFGNAFYQWLKRKNYPDGYQILCANCNLKKQIKEKK